VKPLVLISLLAAAVFLVAGCGSNKKNAGTASQSGEPLQLNQRAFAKFQQCLEDHGVTLPNGRPQGQPRQRPTFDAKTQEAFQACRQYLPAPPQGRFGGQGFNGQSG
jgi:hypothetical protein